MQEVLFFKFLEGSYFSNVLSL